MEYLLSELLIPQYFLFSTVRLIFISYSFPFVSRLTVCRRLAIRYTRLFPYFAPTAAPLGRQMSQYPLLNPAHATSNQLPCAPSLPLRPIILGSPVTLHSHLLMFPLSLRLPTWNATIRHPTTALRPPLNSIYAIPSVITAAFYVIGFHCPLNSPPSDLGLSPVLLLAAHFRSFAVRSHCIMLSVL